MTGWPSGAATGIGSLPGSDIVEAVKTVFGELLELPYLPELPARGPGAELTGRTAGLLVDLPVELYAAQWRFAARPGLDLRRTHDLRERDLDALTEIADGYAGPLKLQVAGPWTLAATLDLPVGGRVLRDPGAVRDLVDSLADGLAGHLAEVAARVPGTSLVLQLDEPALPAVLAGAVPTESGLNRHRPVEQPVAGAALRRLVDRVRSASVDRVRSVSGDGAGESATRLPVVVHCCAPDVPLALLRDAGADAVSLDLDMLNLDLAAVLDPLGEALDAGFGLFAGAVPTSPPAPGGAEVADRVRGLWRRFGFAEEKLPEQVVVTPACGLAGATPAYAREAMTVCREAARRLAD
ncbi:MAG: methionine synthase [Micromonosporaceae bacterium]